jgi:PIN domain nuclease of toxin-antitoxin system
VYLLDTHTLVWGVTAPERLSARVQEILRAEEVQASVVSYWELMLKKGRPNALVADPMPWWERYVTRSSVEVLPIRVAHVDRLDTLAAIHRDPFDRMLVAQALAEECTLVTADSTLFRYGVPAVWE